MLEVFDNDSIHRIQCVRRRDCMPSVELHLRLCITSILALLVCPEGELINDFLLPTPPRTWHRRAGGQLKTWATKINADLEPISGP